MKELFFFLASNLSPVRANLDSSGQLYDKAKSVAIKGNSDLSGVNYSKSCILKYIYFV